MRRPDDRHRLPSPSPRRPGPSRGSPLPRGQAPTPSTAPRLARPRPVCGARARAGRGQPETTDGHARRSPRATSPRSLPAGDAGRDRRMDVELPHRGALDADRCRRADARVRRLGLRAGAARRLGDAGRNGRLRLRSDPRCEPAGRPGRPDLHGPHQRRTDPRGRARLRPGGQPRRPFRCVRRLQRRRRSPLCGSDRWHRRRDPQRIRHHGNRDAPPRCGPGRSGRQQPVLVTGLGPSVVRPLGPVHGFVHHVDPRPADQYVEPGLRRPDPVAPRRRQPGTGTWAPPTGESSASASPPPRRTSHPWPAPSGSCRSIRRPGASCATLFALPAAVCTTAQSPQAPADCDADFSNALDVDQAGSSVLVSGAIPLTTGTVSTSGLASLYRWTQGSTKPVRLSQGVLVAAWGPGGAVSAPG